MSPYRNQDDKTEIGEATSTNGDEGALLWMGLALGILLMASEAAQPGAWGAVGSLGILLSILVLRGLVDHAVRP